MQFPDPWLSEILKPLSDAIVANFSIKVVLLLTVLAQSCIRWRFWRVCSSTPGSKIILGVFPRIRQCRWKRKSQLWQRKKIHHIKDRIFSSPWIFFHPLGTLSLSPLKAAWNLYIIWLSPVLTASEAISTQIRAERDTYPTGYSDFVHGGRYSQMNEIIPYKQDHVWEKISWEHKLIKIFTDRARLLFQRQGKT